MSSLLANFNLKRLLKIYSKIPYANFQQTRLLKSLYSQSLFLLCSLKHLNYVLTATSSTSDVFTVLGGTET